MIEAHRIVENQSQLYGFRATKSAPKAAYVDSVLEATKPDLLHKEWHRLIATPFRYSLPCPPSRQARFRPAYFDRNILYCSLRSTTVLYEHAYHFLKERIHLTRSRDYGQRTAFTLFLNEEAVTDIHGHPDIKAIMDRQNYSASHAFIKTKADVKILSYPSCRDSERGPNYAALEITALGKDIGDERTLAFYFDQADQSVFWTDLGLKIYWNDVC